MKIKNILFLFVFHMLCNGQSIKQLTEFADQLTKEGNHYGASIYYKKAIELDSTDIHIVYKYAHSLKNYNNYVDAAYYYKRITEKDKGGRIYKDANFWLATMQKFNGEYKTASKTWKKAKSLYKNDKKGYHYKKSVREISSCLYALRSQHDTLKKTSIINIGDSANTINSEFAGKLVKNTLQFSSLRSDSINDQLEVFEPNYKVKIYEAIHEEGQWKTRSILDSIINDPSSHNANGTFSLNQKHYYFTRCDSLNNCKIYISSNKNGSWTQPKELPNSINEKGANTTHPNISQMNGKETLFFSSNRSGGIGNMDIWYTEILDGPSFGKAINAGKTINTPDPEITPYFFSKLKTLYFSSTWHNGFGGFDIFKSTFINDKFISPENLSPPINSSWNDLYFWIDSTGHNGFITSNRLGTHFAKGPTCCNDIWKFHFENKEVIIDKEITIKTLDDLNKYLPVTLYFHNDRPGPRSLDTVVKLNYITTYDRYKELQQTYREEYSKGLAENKAIESKLDIDDFFRHYVDKGVHDLELFTNLLLIELEKGEKIEVTVKGFASPLAKTNYNVNLAKRRISSMINYLKEYDKGQFKKYINNGSLLFEKIPFGEYTADEKVSDDYYDQRNSIYNRSAALERRIEIQTIRQANPSDSIFAEIHTEMSSFDFGKLIQGEVSKHTFKITNTGNKELIIENIESSCGCTIANVNSMNILPGKSTKIEVEFNTKGLIGKQVKSITIIADAFPTTKRLVLTAEVFQKEK